MSNFLGDVYAKTTGKVFGDDAGALLDPYGNIKNTQDKADEEEKARKLKQAQDDAAKAALQGRVDDLMNPKEMPTLTSGDQALAARRQKAQMLSRGGRGSTILTGDPLGGGF